MEDNDMILCALVTGIFMGRYVFSVLDIFIDLLNCKIATITNAEAVKVKREQLKLEQEMNAADESPKIGFEYPSSPYNYDDEDEDEEYPEGV